MHKRMDQNFEIRTLWFLRFFEIFTKTLRSPSVANLDHYGRGQTRSQQGPFDRVSSKSVNVEGQKCRSETHRQTHTHRQTNSSENKGPSGLQSGQQTHSSQQLHRDKNLTRNLDENCHKVMYESVSRAAVPPCPLSPSPADLAVLRRRR